MASDLKVKNYKVYKMSLTTLSPIFIGSGETINKSGYLYNQNAGIINIVDERKLVNILREKKLFDSFLGSCIYGDFNFRDFIKKNSAKNYLKIDDITKYRVKTYSKISTYDKNNKETLNDINTFIKSSNGKPYIPGSSIKGAIRTAIVYGEILKNKDKYINIFSELLKTEPGSKDANKLSRVIEKNILGDKIDIFRKFSISDTNETDLSDLYISRRFDLIDNKGMNEKLPIFLEVLRQGIKFDFLLTINGNFSIKELLKYFNNFYNSNEEDNTFYKDYLNLSSIVRKNKIDKYPLFDGSLNILPNIFIGGSNGFLTKSIIYAIRKNKDNDLHIEMSKIVNYMKHYFDKRMVYFNKKLKRLVPQHKHVVKDENISPRTLRFVKDYKDNKNNYIGLGMCEIKVEKELC